MSFLNFTETYESTGYEQFVLKHDQTLLQQMYFLIQAGPPGHFAPPMPSILEFLGQQGLETVESALTHPVSNIIILTLYIYYKDIYAHVFVCVFLTCCVVLSYCNCVA